MEGYYGKLLSWSERDGLLKFISSLHLNTYCYAPKEDPLHRLHWREPYNLDWRNSFSQFCDHAKTANVSVAAGIAPGLNFRFDRKNQTEDFEYLYTKARDLLSDGAVHIVVLWDDIDERDLAEQNNISEGTAHAQVVNRLADKLGHEIWTVPRVYSTEIEDRTNYLAHFISALHPQHSVLSCGNAIVTSKVEPKNLSECHQGSTVLKDTPNTEPKHRHILWDNFYANDYCPRRLFLGPWTGREHIDEYLINPTGLPYTDRLLLDIASSTHTSEDKESAWKAALERHGVPEDFHAIAPYFTQPFFGDRAVSGDDKDIDYIEPTEQIEQAIETCLWKWKSQLSCEWYPFIFGLKHDLALMRDELPRHRIVKTQPPLLAKRLLS